MATHSSILAWRIPCAEEPGRLCVLGVTKGWTWLGNEQAHMHTHADLAQCLLQLFLSWTPHGKLFYVKSKHISPLFRVGYPLSRGLSPARSCCPREHVCWAEHSKRTIESRATSWLILLKHLKLIQRPKRWSPHVFNFNFLFCLIILISLSRGQNHHN